MRSILKAVAAAAALAISFLAHGAPIRYEGMITPPITTVTGTVGGFDFIRQVASGVDFWSFMGRGGNTVSIRGTRLDAALDPALDLYFGTTSADDSLFRTGQSWGGLQFLASADDEIESLVGPFGDPFLTFVLPFTGLYTIAFGGAGSDGEGPYPYSLQVLVVPEPTTILLLVAGVAAVWIRSRRPARPLAT